MKIACESCGARYSIADEKVRGRAVRIRCKRCEQSMVVRGAAAGDAVWHLVVDGEQRGPLRAADVTQMLTDGSIDERTYVWRSGLETWVRVHDVEELAVAGAADTGAAVVVSLGGSAAGLSAGTGMTAARSESSVLFSLGNLQSLALRGRPAPSAPLPLAGPAGSGLLDLRALVGGASTTAPTHASDRAIDDLLGVGVAGAFPPALGAPVSIAAPGRSSKLLHVLVAVAATLLLGIVALLAVALTQSPPAPVAPPPPLPISGPAPVAVAPRLPTTPPAPALATSPEVPAPEVPRPRAPGPRRPATDGTPARPVAPDDTEPPRPTAPATIEELVRRAVDPEHAAADQGPATTLPAQPDRAEVHAALRAVQGNVRACAAGQVGTASIRFVFAPNGVVTTASVTSPPFAGTSAGSCMARAARVARVPPFSRPSLVVSFPYVVR